MADPNTNVAQRATAVVRAPRDVTVSTGPDRHRSHTSAAAQSVALDVWPWPTRTVRRQAPTRGYSAPAWTLTCTGATLVHRIAERDGSWTCRYCEIELTCCDSRHVVARDPGRILFDRPGAIAEHVIPRSRGGTDDITNRVLTCHWCNVSKGARTPAEWFATLVRRGEFA